MNRLSSLALAAGLLLTAVAADPPPGGGNIPPGNPFPQPAGPPPGGPPMAAPGPPQSATPSPNDMQMLARAKNWFAQLQAGKIDRSQLAPGMGSLSDEQVANVSTQIKSLGTPVTFEQQQTMVQNDTSVALYLLTFGNGKKLDFIFAVNSQGKVAGLRLQPEP
jgi:hypothetical protein